LAPKCNLQLGTGSFHLPNYAEYAVYVYKYARYWKSQTSKVCINRLQYPIVK